MTWILLTALLECFDHYSRSGPKGSSNGPKGHYGIKDNLCITWCISSGILAGRSHFPFPFSYNSTYPKQIYGSLMTACMCEDQNTLIEKSVNYCLHCLIGVLYPSPTFIHLCPAWHRIEGGLVGRLAFHKIFLEFKKR